MNTLLALIVAASTALTAPPRTFLFPPSECYDALRQQLELIREAADWPEDDPRRLTEAERRERVRNAFTAYYQCIDMPRWLKDCYETLWF